MSNIRRIHQQIIYSDMRSFSKASFKKFSTKKNELGMSWLESMLLSSSSDRDIMERLDYLAKLGFEWQSICDTSFVICCQERGNLLIEYMIKNKTRSKLNWGVKSALVIYLNQNVKNSLKTAKMIFDYTPNQAADDLEWLVLRDGSIYEELIVHILSKEDNLKKYGLLVSNRILEAREVSKYKKKLLEWIVIENKILLDERSLDFLIYFKNGDPFFKVNNHLLKLVSPQALAKYSKTNTEGKSPINVILEYLIDEKIEHENPPPRLRIVSLLKRLEKLGCDPMLKDKNGIGAIQQISLGFSMSACDKSMSHLEDYYLKLLKESIQYIFLVDYFKENNWKISQLHIPSLDKKLEKNISKLNNLSEVLNLFPKYKGKEFRKKFLKRVVEYQRFNFYLVWFVYNMHEMDVSEDLVKNHIDIVSNYILEAQVFPKIGPKTIKVLKRYPANRILNLFSRLDSEQVFQVKFLEKYCKFISDKAVNEIKLPSKPKNFDELSSEIKAVYQRYTQKNIKLEFQNRLSFLDEKLAQGGLELFRIKIPKDIHSLITIGSTFHNCLGDGTYINNIKRRVSNIVILEGSENYCLNISLDFKILEARGKYNEDMDEELKAEIQSFILDNVKELRE